jgi:hypothetical protein
MSVFAAETQVELGPGLMGVIHEPESRPVGIAVVAPGAGFDMDQPLIKAVARKAAAVGYRAVRFNWRYYTAGTERGSSTSAEVTDLRDVIHHLVQSSDDVSHIVLIGKSLGSIVVSSVAAETGHPMILLTPVCRNADEFAMFYATVDTPVVMIAGDRDPLCDVNVLFDNVNRSTKLAIVQGDHSFNGDSDRDSDRNVAVVTRLVGYWLDSWRR